MFAALLLGTTAATAPVVAAIAHTSTAAVQVHSFNIPVQSLTEAVMEFGQQSGYQVSADTALVSGKQNSAVIGSLVPDAALMRLLNGTGLGFRFTGPTTVTLQPASAVTSDNGSMALPPVQVVGQSGPPKQSVIGNLPPAYAGGQVATGSQLGMLGNRSVMNTPFTTTSYTAKTIADDQARSIADVLSNSPAVRSLWAGDSYTDALNIRGFPVGSSDISLNGLYGVLPYQLVAPDFAERVELLEGPSALLNGLSPTGAVGGAVNIVPKRATDEPITRVTTEYQSNAQFGTEVDVGRRFGSHDQWGIRFNGTIDGGDTGVAHQSQHLGNAVMGADYRGSRLRVSLDLGFQNQAYNDPRQPIYVGSGITSIPSPPSASSNIFAPWSYFHTSDTFGALQAEYDVQPNMTVFGGLGFRENHFTTVATQPTLTSNDGTMTNTPYKYNGAFNSVTGQTGLRGTFDTGFVHHSYSLIASSFRQEFDDQLVSATDAITTNLYNPSWGTEPDFPGYTGSLPRASVTILSGLAAADTLSVLNDRIQLTVGARQQWISATNYSTTTGAVSSKYNDTAATPAVGFVVKPWRNVSFYMNYIEGLQQGTTVGSSYANAGEALPPYIAKQIETGVKVDWGGITTTLSLFQISKPSASVDTATNTYTENGEQRNRGLEINTFGEVAPGVRLLGGVTFMNGVLIQNSIASENGNQATGTPRVQMNFGGEWDTPFVPGLTVTGRVIYTSSEYADNANTLKVPGWETFDLGARYRFNRANGKPVTIRATIQNLLNKSYWADASSVYGLTEGAPRTFLVSTTFDF